MKVLTLNGLVAAAETEFKTFYACAVESVPAEIAGDPRRYDVYLHGEDRDGVQCEFEGRGRTLEDAVENCAERLGSWFV